MAAKYCTTHYYQKIDFLFIIVPNTNYLLMNITGWKKDSNIIISRHKITFSKSFKRSLRTYRIVDYCTNGSYYDNQTQCLIIPFDVTDMTFDDAYNCEVIVFPNIKTLRFGRCFNQPIVLGSNVEVVQFGKKFCNFVALNRHVVKLVFGDSINRFICLNKRLRFLEFSNQFNQPILLNYDLEQVEFGHEYMRPLSLGPNVKVLVLKNTRYNQNIFLTKRIVHLRLGNVNTCVKLPKCLKHLSLSELMLKTVTLGKNLRSLKIYESYGNHLLSLEKTNGKNNDYISIQIYMFMVVIEPDDDDDDNELLFEYTVEDLSNNTKCDFKRGNARLILNNLPNDVVICSKPIHL